VSLVRLVYSNRKAQKTYDMWHARSCLGPISPWSAGELGVGKRVSVVHSGRLRTSLSSRRDIVRTPLKGQVS